MEDIEKIKQYVQIIQKSATKLLEVLEEVSELPKNEKISKYEPDWDEWPEAVPDFLISKPGPAGIIKKARAALDACDITDLEGRHFLDFGCGDGSVVKEAISRRASTVTGFDIVEDNAWNSYSSVNNLLLTSNFEDLKKGFYDTILLFDVLDHSSDPTLILNQVRDLVSNDGQVRVRCHPYTSRHANHVWKTFNKAYCHLFLTPEQLAEHDPLPVLKMTGVDPLEEYKRWFVNAGFITFKEAPITCPVDKICTKNVPRQELKKIVNHENFMKILEIEFVDYCLVLKK